MLEQGRGTTILLPTLQTLTDRAKEIADSLKPDKRLDKLYAKYNHLYFDDALPPCDIRWLDMGDEEDIGYNATLDTKTATAHSIFIDSNIKSLWTIVKMTLLHEMAHVALHPYAGHGKKFNEEMLRLACRGAFDGLW